MANESANRDVAGYSLESLARDVLGEAPVSIDQVLVSGRGFAPPFVHRVRGERHVVYLKHGLATEIGGRFALEAWAFEQCRKRGVRAPEVLSVSGPGDDVEHVATLALRGSALWQQGHIRPQALRNVLQNAGEQLRSLHEVEIDGYGTITSPGVGRDSRWCSLIDFTRGHGLNYLVDRGVLTSAGADDVYRLLDEASRLIPPDLPSRLIHGDLEGDHVFAHRGEFTGFIDFEKMMGGDPVYDLARFAWWDPHMLGDLVDGYGRDRISDEDVEIRMPAYLVANFVGRRAARAPVDATKPFPVEGARKFLNAARDKDFRALVEPSPAGIGEHEVDAATVAALKRADELLASEQCWSSSRERAQESTDGTYTLYSALAVALREVKGAFVDGDPALGLVREQVVDRYDDRGWKALLADVNAETSFVEVKDLLRAAIAAADGASMPAAAATPQ